MRKGKGDPPKKASRSQHVPMTRNPMLVLTIWLTVADETVRPTLKHAVVHVAVNAWYEGHIEAHTVRNRPSLELVKDSDERPSPPWPGKDDPKLWEIVDDTLARFEEDVAHGALAYAASLAWTAGYREGETCAGCSARGQDAAEARNIRAGLVPIDFDPQAKALRSASTRKRRS